jgi:hypothetical protein
MTVTTLTPADYQRAALDLADYTKPGDVPPSLVAAIRAVASVESKGSGFLADNIRPVILFERHIMRKRLIENLPGKQSPAVIQFADPAIVNSTPGGYKGGAAEWDRLAQAIAIDRTSALESCSWGAFQIMGFWWRSLGYSSIQAFVNSMYASAGGQLDAFVKFIKTNPNLLRALRNQDWPAFAKGYNGADYAINKYDTKMASAFTNLSKEQTA